MGHPAPALKFLMATIRATFSLAGDVREYSSTAGSEGAGAPGTPVYSGKHDHGDLPAVRAESSVVLGLRAAKADSDTFLSAAIESAKLDKGEDPEAQVAKKPRR